MKEEVPSRSEMIEEFIADQASCFSSGAINNITDISLTIVSVLASLAATVLVSTGICRILAASVAAVPAACTALQRIVDFRGRSIWYFRHAANLKALAVSLKFAKEPNLEEFAKKRADIEIEGESRWAGIGAAMADAKRENRPRRKTI
jgi:hypothetical protein